jgi:hypothetical protein
VTESQTVGTCNCTCNLTRLRKRRLLYFPQGTGLSPNIHKRPSRTPNPAAPGTQASPLAIGPQHSSSHACLRSYAKHERLPCSIPHFTANSVGDARPVDAGRYWACMTLRYSWVPKRRRTQTRFFFRGHTGLWDRMSGVVRSVGCQDARLLSRMLACVDARRRSHARAQLASWDGNCYICWPCSGAVGVIDSKSHYYIRSMHHHRTAAAVRH